MAKTELKEEVTIETLIMLNEKFGFTFEVNDGQITGVNFPEQKVQKTRL